MSTVSLLTSLSNDDLPSSRRRFSAASPPASTPISTAKARNSHYRPFSTLYTDSPFIDIQDKSSSSSLLKRHSSIASLQTFVHMGIGFKDKAKAKKLDAELMEIKMPSSPSPTRFPLQPHLNLQQRPSTSSAAINSPPALHRVKNKKSMPSVPDPSTSSAVSSAVSPSSNPHHQLSLPRSTDIPITSNVSSTSTKKKTRFLAQDHEPSECFIPKSRWAKRHNMKLHPYHHDVPYMQAYDPILLDSDRYSDLLLQRLNYGYPSFHNYSKNPPATVLDLGCGPGHWVLHAASVWKTSQITGLDLVDLTLPGFETTENADFVLGNFVAFDLPFPDNSFDYVRMANLVLCIPYEKWDYVLRQVHRVLTVNGRLELIDDQIFFPYSSAPKPPSSWSPEMSDAFDDSYFDDKETLQGSGSDTGSTLDANSEPSNSSCEDQIADLPTLRPIASYQSPTPTGSPCQSPSAVLDTESRYISWRNQATASRELESIFEIMLKQRYRIFPRPSDFILNRMECVFGRNAAGKTRSYHIKLAPIGSADAYSGQGEETKSNGGIAKKKPWMGLDREKRKEKKLKKTNSPTSKADTSTGSVSSGSSSERSSLENSIPITSPVPASTNMKAAGRLGFAFVSSLKETASTPPPTPTPQPDQAQVPLLSAKAAGRLGISYSDLAAATVASTHQQPAASPSPSPLQSPGLFVWPSTFIPLTPAELEMHANKYVHTLLGCKPALAEFITQFANEDGTRLLDDDEFHDIMWKYECFRRSRFNWPSEIPDPYDDEPTVDLPISPLPPLKSKLESKLNKNGLDLAYNGEELTHIRTIRVFEATKSDDWSFTSLFHHKSPPPTS